MAILRRETTRTFTRTLFGPGILETIILKKRGDDQRQGQVTDYLLFDCFLPGTKVEGRATTASKAVYSGKAVELRTKTGALLNSTVNHPILTPDGFTPAGQIEPGDYLLCKFGDVKRSPVHEKDDPTVIEKVFEAFAKRGDSLASRMPIPLDFHGDGISLKRQIYVVRPNGELLNDIIPSNAECLSDCSLIRLDPSLLFKHALSDSDSRSERFFDSLDSLMSSGNLMPPFFDSHLGPFDPFTITGRAKDHPSSEQYSPYNAFGGREFLAQKDKRLSGKISRNNIFGGEFVSCFGFDRPQSTCLRSSSQFDSMQFESFYEGGMADARLATQLVRRFPSEVSIDKVLEVRYFHYDGPVYDLETTVGYYTASTKGNKVFVSNCRRSAIAKGGETIQGDNTVDHRTVWHIPKRELDRVGINFISALDRIVQTLEPEKGNTWEPEATTMIDVKLFGNEVDLACLRTDSPAS